MSVNQLYHGLLGWSGANAWIAQIFFVVFLILLSNLLLRFVLKRLQRNREATSTRWDDAVIAAIYAPLRLMVWVVGITFAAELAYAETEIALLNIAEPIRQIGVVAALAWFLLRVLEIRVMRDQGVEKKIDKATLNVIGKLLRLCIFIVAALMMMQTLGFSISGILAFGGIGGIAIGFAAKDMLANFFGGLMLHLDRPFAVGDWVLSPDREIEGTVEHIGWRLTRIRAFDMRPIYIPNGVFSTMAIINPSRMTHRQIYETIGIRYCDADKMAEIVNAVEAMLTKHAGIDQSETLIVKFNQFAPSSLDFFIYAFTSTTKWIEFHEIKQDVLLQIHAVIKAHGAEIAFPTSTMQIPEPIRVMQNDA